jgi:16S rRNA (adenine1518-N6/adenine1519-N6)-dimethyltransferase
VTVVAAHRTRKRLGQHFLADDNILRVIGRLAELERDDIVLEVGPGLGVLTRYLADNVAFVHAVELDRSLETLLGRAIAGVDNVTIHWADAMRMDFATLDPAPEKLVANLPYNIATPLLAEVLAGGGAVQRFCVMVQREVADRFFASPGTKAYGAVSVLVQLTARRTGHHPVSRHVFRPPPRVESSLLAFERVTPPAELARVRRIVDAAFAHRRKTLANSLELSGLAGRPHILDCLETLGLPPMVRAEALEPHAFVALAGSLDP